MRNFLVIAFCALILAGCGTFFPGKGEKLPEAQKESIYPASMERVRKASLQVLDELKITVYSIQKGSRNNIEGMRDDGTEVLLALEQMESGKTLLKIQVRTKGADDLVRLIDSGIEQKLSKRRQSKRKKMITAASAICSAGGEA